MKRNILIVIIGILALTGGVGIRYFQDKKVSQVSGSLVTESETGEKKVFVPPEVVIVSTDTKETSAVAEKNNQEFSGESLQIIEPSVAPGPTCLSDYVFREISTKELTENITFAVNKEYADSHPEWQERAGELIDYINNVLSQNTGKRYKISKFLTYPTSKYPSLSDDGDYHLSDGSYGGTTIFYFVYDHATDVPKIVSDTNFVNAASKSVIDGQVFYNLWLVNRDTLHVLMGRTLLSQQENQTEETYDSFMTLPLHELGHTLGLAFGEWYNYDFVDKTNIPPNLGNYSFKDIYPYDPMAMAERFPYKFSGLNASLTRLNANHQFSFEDIAKMHSPKAFVRVKDDNGNSVSGATVKVFGAKKNAFYTKDNGQPLLQLLTTDSSGMVEIDNIDSNFQLNDSPTVGWVAKIIKASKSGKSGGSIFTLVDSQISCIVNKSQTHYIDIVLN